MADSPNVERNVNWGSQVVNGQLVPQAPSSAFFPMPMGHQYVNPKWSTQYPYGVPPVIPSPALQPQPPGQSSIAPTQAGNKDNASAWHPTKGVLVFGLFAAIAGLFLLNYVHYGSSKK